MSELLTTLETSRDALDKGVLDQKAKTALAFAAAGRQYGTDKPLRFPALTPEIVASEAETVLDRADAHPIPHFIAWSVTVVSGVAAGISLGLAAHFLFADTLRRQVLLAVLCSLFGLATSVSLKYGLESVWREVSLRLHGGKNWTQSAAVALSLTALVITIYCTVERRGLMSGMLVEIITQNIRGHKAMGSLQIQIAATFGSLFLTVPYTLLVSCMGFRKGRHTVVAPRAEALLLRQQTEADELQRSCEPMRAAFKEEALTTHAQQQVDRFEARSKAKVERLQNEIAALEARKKSLREEASAAPTSWQRHLGAEQDRLTAERQRREGEMRLVETQIQQLRSKPEAPTATEANLKAARDQVRLLKTRIAWEEQQARKAIELLNGNLWQRVGVALGWKKPVVGTLEHQLKSK